MSVTPRRPCWSPASEGQPGPPMVRPQPPFLAPPFLAPAGWPGACGEGEERGGRGNGAGAPHPWSPGCGTNQFSPNFFLGQSGDRSDREFHSRRSGARPNAEQTRSPTASLPPRSPNHSQSPITRTPVMPCGSTRTGGDNLTPPKAQGCPTLTGPQLGGWRPTALSPAQAEAGPPGRASLFLRRVCGQRPRAALSCPGGWLWGHRGCRAIFSSRCLGCLCPDTVSPWTRGLHAAQ